MSAEQEIQALCETYVGRKFTNADQKLLRKFLSDLQRQKVDEEERDTKPEIITKPWESRKKPEDTPLAADAPVQPMVRADSKIFSRVEGWAYMAAEANKQPEPKRDAPVSTSALGSVEGVSQRSAKYTQVAEALSPRGNRPSDLPQSVGIKDRVGRWKNAEEGKGPVYEKPAQKTGPSDLPVEVDIGNRLGKWKNAEEGKGAVDAKPVQKTGPADLEVEVDIGNRLGKWKNAEEGKGPVNDKPVQKSGPADLQVEVDIGNRLGKWKDAEEGKNADNSTARKAPIVIKVATEDGEEQVVQAAQVKDRMNTYVKVTEEAKPSAAVKATDDVQEAPKLKDRLQNYNKAAEEKSVEKAAIVVPYEDGFDADKPPMFPAEGDATPAAVVKPANYKRPIDEVGSAPSLKDRLKALEHAVEDRPIEKAKIVVPYEDGYDPSAAHAIGEEHHESAPIRREPVKIEGGSSLKDRLNNWSEATVDKPVPKTAVDIPDPEDD